MATAKWDGKRWRLRVSINGSVRSFSSTIPGRRGREDVERRARESGRLSELVSFGTAWNRYLEEVEALTGPENYTNTESIGRNYLLPELRDRKLSSLTLQDFQTILFRARKKDGSELSKKTLSNIRGVIVNFSKYCQGAKIMDLPLSLLRVPKNAPKVGKEILQPDQARRLMHDFEDEWYINLWRWLLCTGMRPGEALGLKWSDIENGIVTIRRAQNYRGRETEGKNDNARRSFMLNSILDGILADQNRKTWRLNSEYVFCNHAGKVSLQTVTKNSWCRISREMGSKTSPYGLRHTFISFMSQALPEQALKDWVGHSVRMDTYGTYRHAVNGEAERTAQMANIALVEKLT
mgnify:FL=1